jgi:hypothetical protein
MRIRGTANQKVDVGQDLLLDTVRMRHLLRDFSDIRGKIARMLKSGELIPLRRGLYASRRNTDARCLAGPIYGPSYVSFETALAWHGIIPESVTECLSATPRRAAGVENVFGRFRYLQVPAEVYPVGVQRVTDSDLPFLLASPTKALCDRIAREAGFRSMADVERWLGGMRIDSAMGLNSTELELCEANYGRPAVRLLRQFALKKGLVESQTPA